VTDPADPTVPTGVRPSVSTEHTDSVLRQIADSVAGLDGLEQLPLSEAAQRFSELHAELQGALTDLDRG
jgi:hypothetical protein